MEIEILKLSDIKEYANNAKLHPQNQIEQIKRSIEELGMNDPIVVDEHNVIIEGHGRYKALLELGVSECPCIRLTHLTEEQKRAYILIHNKLTLNTDFDIDTLNFELDNIFELDMKDFGFDLDFNFGDEDEAEEPEPSHRETTYKKYNLEFVDLERTAGFYQMPIIQRETYIPEDLIGFNYMLTSKNKDVGIHCFVDDYQFERLWTSPTEYIEKIAEYECFLSPDFSLYLDMPMSMKIWNIYRSRLIGQIMQDSGIIVIPTVSWAEPETFTFCFDGIEPGGVVAISTIGVKREESSFKVWKDGMDEMIKRLRPHTILCYGGEVEYDYKGIPVVYYDNHVTEKMKEIKN